MKLFMNIKINFKKLFTKYFKCVIIQITQTFNYGGGL